METVAYDCRKKSISQTTTLWTYIMKRASSIKDVTSIMDDIVVSSQTQIANIKWVNVAIDDIDDRAKNNAALVGKVTTEADDLKTQSSDLAGVVRSFIL
jgi:methyl-accepting chemotaxis protein